MSPQEINAVLTALESCGPDIHLQLANGALAAAYVALAHPVVPPPARDPVTLTDPGQRAAERFAADRQQLDLDLHNVRDLAAPLDRTDRRTVLTILIRTIVDCDVLTCISPGTVRAIVVQSIAVSLERAFTAADPPRARPALSGAAQRLYELLTQAARDLVDQFNSGQILFIEGKVTRRQS